MDYVRNALLLPDEALFALNNFLSYNITENANTNLATENCNEKAARKLYPVDNDSDESRSLKSNQPRSRLKDFQSSMQRNTNNFQEETGYRCSTNGQASRQKPPSGAQGKLSPSCRKSKDFSGCNSAQCPNDTPYHQEEHTVYPCQDQALRQQLKRYCPPQAPLNRSQQCQKRFSRSQSVPRTNSTHRYNISERFDCPRGLHAGQDKDTVNPSRSRCARNPKCEGDACTRETCSFYQDRNSRSNNASGNWNDSSQVDSNCGERQRRPLQLQQPCQQQQQPHLQQQQSHLQQQQSCQQHPRQQQQHHRQRQCPSRHQQSNECNMSALEDDEISGFEPDLNSTMIENEKRCRKSTINSSQPQMPRQYASCNKSCSSQNQRKCRTSEEMLRRQPQCETPQMPRRAAQQQSQCESTQMDRRKPQQYETLISHTSYLDLPETLRDAKCKPRIDKTQCPNHQAMDRDISNINIRKPCQRSKRSQSLSPVNRSKYQSPATTSCSNETDMDDSDFYPEDTKCARGPTYNDMSRAMLSRAYLNETSLEKSNRHSGWAGQSTRMPPKTPEEYLAERTQAEFMEALVKDRTCPGAIQSTLNGNENFNEFAFDIAFAGPIPSKPFPVDPITMLEAIKLRIDFEREEIRKNHRPVTTEDIETHFFEKNKTEVNEGVAAFLKAESEYQSNEQPDTFDVEMNSLDTNMFDDSIKLNVYSAITKPGQGVLNLGYH